MSDTPRTDLVWGRFPLEKVTDHRYIESCKLEHELAKVTAELEEETAVRERLATLLAETAVALKGEEKPLCGHDWSDLPKVAHTLRLACDIGEELIGQERERAEKAEAELANERDAHVKNVAYLCAKHDNTLAELAAARGMFALAVLSAGGSVWITKATAVKSPTLVREDFDGDIKYSAFEPTEATEKKEMT